MLIILKHLYGVKKIFVDFFPMGYQPRRFEWYIRRDGGVGRWVCVPAGGPYIVPLNQQTFMGGGGPNFWSNGT